MNKPITTRVNQSSSMGMKVREPMLDVGSVAKQAKEDANKIEKVEGYSLGQDGSVQYGNTTTTTTGGTPDKTVTTNLTDRDVWDTNRKNVKSKYTTFEDYQKAAQKYRNETANFTPDTKTTIVKGTDPVSTTSSNVESLKKKTMGNYVAPWTLRQDIRGDKIAKNKAQRQKLKTMRDSGELGDTAGKQFGDALKKKKTANVDARADKKQARKDKRQAMKDLRGKKGDMTDAEFKAAKGQIKSDKSSKMDEANKTIKSNRKQFKEDVGNIKSRKEKKKEVKQEYNKKLGEALDAKLDVRVKGSQQGATHTNKDQKVEIGTKNMDLSDFSPEKQKEIIGGSSPASKLKSPYKMYTKSPFKMSAKSPLTKALVGNQNKLPQHLQDAIKAAPGKNYKKGYYGK